MPRGDGTGPMGRGPMTGRGLGLCAGLAIPALAGLAFAHRRGARGGRGWRNMFHATGLTGWQRAAVGLSAFGCGVAEATDSSMTTDREIESLRQQAESLKAQIGNINQRIEELATQRTVKA